MFPFFLQLRPYSISTLVTIYHSALCHFNFLNLKVKCKGNNVFQIYTILDSDFSTFIENNNDFKLSQAV